MMVLRTSLFFPLSLNRSTHHASEHTEHPGIATRHPGQQPHDALISVDAKKKELVSDCKNTGREWHPEGEPEQVRVYDFPIPDLGRATPYGIYDLERNRGWVNGGINHDMAAFAVESIRRWRHQEGKQRYPEAKRLLISADGGGSNGSQVRLWKGELQQLADELGLAITVCHLPPGTSKWKKIEHRLFAWISQNWRGKPLVDDAMIVKVIAATSTEAGLTVECHLDTNTYPTGRKISDEHALPRCRCLSW